MKKKIIIVILTILFVLVLILLNVFLNNQNEQMLEQMADETSEVSNEGGNKMEILKVTNANFEEEVLQSEKTVLIDFYADWCGPCKMLSPIVEEVANENESVKVVKVDVDIEQELALKYDVISIPTLVVIKNGEEVDRVVGFVGKSEILNMIK